MADARSAILMGLRLALAGAPEPADPAPVPAPPALGWDDFAAACERCGARFTLAADWAAARQAVADILAETEAATACAWDHPDLEPLNLPELCAEQGVTLHDNTTANLATADVGVTAAHGAILESGSVLVAATPDTPRATSLLPTTHIALVPKSRTIPTIAELPAFLRSLAPTPSAVHAITGPSSTGDIEMVVIKGVHGPVSVYVVAIEQA